MHGDRHDGTEAGTAAMLYSGAVLGVLLRGATWVFSAFTVGPVLGALDTLAGELGDRRGVLFAQGVLSVVAVVSAIIGGLGLQSDPGRYRLPVRLLCGLFILDALLYLAPLVLAAALAFIELTTAQWALFGVAVVGNLGLAGLALLIIVRVRKPLQLVAPRPATTIVLS